MARTHRLLPGARVAAVAAAWLAITAHAQQVTLDSATRYQTIDGFGACHSGDVGGEAWFQQLYYDDLRASIFRIDITPPFVSPYSDHVYNSPWFGNTPSIDSGGPEGNYVRTYTNATDYTRLFGGQRATIAVMGPDLDANVALFDFTKVSVPGGLAQLGKAKAAELGGFKLYGSMWSPAPWLKLSSGNSWPGGAYPLPTAGTAWPFVWGGNFAGGILDTSGTPRAEFDDSSLGGTGPTSALTQFARSLAAYLRGFQTTYGVSFYAISIQNEVNFEEFYNSCSYPLASQYLAALKAARAELDRYDDLKDILIAGPEDLLGGDAWGLWQYGGGSDVTHKNLQYLQAIGADPTASAAVAFFNIHGYDADGASAAGADPQSWSWWVNGWSTAPAAGLPAAVAGFAAYGKKSWMTETSGEATSWLGPTGPFPGSGGWSIALKLHQALTTGRESAWLYWQLADGNDLAAETLTDATALATSPKYVAAKHFFRHIRPGAQAVGATVTGPVATLLASAYVHDAAGTLTVVIVNASDAGSTVTVVLPAAPAGLGSFEAFTSSDSGLWSASTLTAAAGQVAVPVPGFGVVTLVGQGQPAGDGGVGPGDGGAPGDGGSGGGDAAADGGGGNGAKGSCGCAGGGGSGGLAAALLVLALVGAGRRVRLRAR
jgi:O-glycosyl hydrolase